MSEHLNTQEGVVDGGTEIQEPVVLDAELVKAIADYSIIETEGEGYSNQLEGATYNESFAEFMGGLPSIMGADAYLELTKSHDEISEKALADFETVGNDVAAIALDTANESYSEAARNLARVSTLGTHMANVEGGAEEEEATEVVPTGAKVEREELSFWDKHRTLQKALLAGMSALGLMAATPAAAGGDHYRDQIRAHARAQRDQVVNGALAGGLNIILGTIQSGLENRGVITDSRSPIPIPGTPESVYGGGLPVPPIVVHGGGQHLPPVGGVYRGGGLESESRLQLQAHITGLKLQLHRQATEEQNYATAELQAYNNYRADPSNAQKQRDYVNYQAARANARISIEQTIRQIQEAQIRLNSTQ